MTFFKTFLAALLAIFSTVFLVFLLGGIIVGGIVAASEDKEAVKIEDNSILHLRLNGEIVENAKPDDLGFEKYLPTGGFEVDSKIGLYQLVEAIRAAKKDDNIKGIYLNTNGAVSAGWATLKTIYDELQEFKKSGKFIYSYAEVYTEKSYYLSTTADKLFIPPSGAMEFNGFAAQPMFYTGLFEKLELEPKIYRVGTFKSAVEPYFRKDMSEESKMQVSAFLGDIWEIFANDVAAARKIDRAEVDSIASQFVFGSGENALKRKLIDEVKYEDAVRELLKEKSGIDKKEKLRLVSLRKYLKTMPKEESDATNKIAVIFAEGEIRSGKNEDGVMGSETIVEALRKAREDEKVKAIVFRVNSPGGSALASDIMTREVELTAKVKPIIASMGDVAASGGYYISAKCDHIFADKNTITGSIGIFGVLFNTQKMLNNKLGLTFDQVETHTNADFMNPNVPASPFQEKLMQHYIEEGYGSFLQVVKEGRNFPDSLAVDKVAQGRVWSGKAAKDINLIDDFGNLYAAIQYAAKKANLDEKDYRIKTYPEAKNKLEEIFDFSKETAVRYLEKDQPLHEEVEQLRKLKQAIPSNGVYMMMPARYVIE